MRVITERVDFSREAQRLLKQGITIAMLAEMTVHQLFVTLFQNEIKGDGQAENEITQSNRVAMLQVANEYRAKKGWWPVIPSTHWG